MISRIKTNFIIFKAFLYRRLVRPVKIFANKIKYPGEEQISILDIATFFYIGLQKGDIQTRARSIAFDFFLAIFPAVIFFFTLIPYIPIDGIQDKILILLQDILPPYTFEAARLTIEDILKQPRGGLLSFGFIFALYISTNGINSMIEGFNSSYHGIAIRSAFKQRMVSLFLTFMLAVIVIISVALIFIAEIAADFMVEKDFINKGPKLFLLKAGTWFILVIMSLMMISFLYFFGPSKKNRRPFISVGSVIATILVVLTTVAFNWFIGNFGQYNKIYGSIGTLIVILLWINFNSLQLIIGFELNASIENAKRKTGKLSASGDDKDVKIKRTV